MMNMFLIASLEMRGIFQDWKANKKNIKGRIILILFRLASLLRNGPNCILPITVVYGVFYRFAVEWVLGIELPWKTRIGAGLRVDHGQALIVNDQAIIGAGCCLRNGTTIGLKELPDGSLSAAPVIGNCVNVGSNAAIIGPVKIGDGVVIGAGAVVVKDVPAGAIVAGNPAKIIRMASEM